jgi:hypothetical protein
MHLLQLEHLLVDAAGSHLASVSLSVPKYTSDQADLIIVRV